MRKFAALIICYGQLFVCAAAWSQCTGVNTGGQCLPPPCTPGSPLFCPNQPQAQQAPKEPPPNWDIHAAFAIDDHIGLSWSIDQRTEKKAIDGALKNCSKRGGTACRLVGTFWGCAAIAQNPQGYSYFNKDDSMGIHNDLGPNDAARNAMRVCNHYTPAGRCFLLTTGVCSGLKPSYSTAANARANSATLEDLISLSNKMDAREYWGAAAFDGEHMRVSYNAPSREDAASWSSKDCANCKVVSTFQNSCLATASPINHKPVYETAVNTDPAVANANALAQCSSKYGVCKAVVGCVGRNYLKTNPDLPDTPANK